MTPRPPKRATVDARPVAQPGPLVAPVAGGPGTHSSQDREDDRTPDPRPSQPGSRHLEPGTSSPSLLSQTPTEAVTRIPDPVAGARLPDRVRAPGRVRSQIPAGGAVDADAALPDRPAPRSYMLVLPPGLKMLNLNDRGHWAVRHRRSQALKKAAWAMALQAKIPRLERVRIVMEYQPPDRRRRDSDNPVASAKACIDGIVAAGVLEDDDSPRHVSEVACRIGQPYPGGRLLLHLTEVAP